MFGIAESAQNFDGCLKAGCSETRLLGDLSGGRGQTLVLNGLGHFHRTDSAGGEALRIQPDTNVVIALPEVVDVADAFEAEEFVLHVNGGVVTHVEVVVATIW